MSANIAENLARVREHIAASCARAGHDPREITLVAVTKTFPLERIREAMAEGLHIFGENRVQEAVPKIDAIGTTEVAWHLIGHLQSNKARFVEGRFAMVQSIDSVGIVETLGRRLQRPLEVLIEVNVAAEPQKTGALEPDLAAIVEAIGRYPNLTLRGLMTVAPMSDDPAAVRPVFRKLRALRDATAGGLGRALPVLSMGMSDDYEVAVEEGATMLRLGRAIFGAR